MARKFFYVCAGMLMLALSYHLGASTAIAQAPANPVVAAFGNSGAVVTANGDVYVGGGGSANGWTNWVLASNVFSGGPVPAQRETWGQLKSRFAPNPGTPTSETNPR